MSKKNKKGSISEAAKAEESRMSVEELVRRGSDAQAIYDYQTAIEFYEEIVYILRDGGYVHVRDGEVQIHPQVDLDSIVFPTTAD